MQRGAADRRLAKQRLSITIAAVWYTGGYFREQAISNPITVNTIIRVWYVSRSNHLLPAGDSGLSPKRCQPPTIIGNATASIYEFCSFLEDMKFHLCSALHDSGRGKHGAI